jgi:hypothetical protein
MTLYGDLYNSVQSILFFGTPHLGSDAAAWAVSLGHISKAVGIRRTSVIKELKTWSNTLMDLTVLFSDRARNFSIITFVETQPTYGVIVCAMSCPEKGEFLKLT